MAALLSYSVFKDLRNRMRAVTEMACAVVLIILVFLANSSKIIWREVPRDCFTTSPLATVSTRNERWVLIQFAFQYLRQ